MQTTQSYTRYYIASSIVLIIAFLINISLGSVSIPIKDIITTLTGGIPSKNSWEFIIINYRLPKAITACISGSGLAVAGLLMQTLFRNPLAGPFVLGLSSGASLGVAILLLGAGFLSGITQSILLSNYSLVIAAALGCFMVLLAVLAVTLRIKDTMAILIIGLMFGSLTGAVVAILSYFSNAEQLQQYIFWSFGSLGNLSWGGLIILAICFILGVLISVAASKSLNALLLGENYAKTMGVRYKHTTLLIIVATSLLAGSITAFAGPIAFVGLAVPHLTRQFIKTSNHNVLIPAVLLSGAILMLLCDTIAQIPFTQYTIPINAVTSLVGAPVVIWLLIRKQKLLF